MLLQLINGVPHAIKGADKSAIVYFNGKKWVTLRKGVPGQVLGINSNNDLAWLSLHAYSDTEEGNAYDGGCASVTYLTSQQFEGGDAGTSYLDYQFIDGGLASSKFAEITQTRNKCSCQAHDDTAYIYIADDIEGGGATIVYLTEQMLDGGNAYSTEYLSDLTLEGGNAFDSTFLQAHGAESACACPYRTASTIDMDGTEGGGASEEYLSSQWINGGDANG